MKSFVFALRGILSVAERERHMRIHLCFAFYVVLAGFVTRLTPSEWSRVLFCVALVCSMECLNTAVERACDARTKRRDAVICLAKDAAAGAVLVSAAASAVIGSLTFFQAAKVANALTFIKEDPVLAVLVVLALVPWSIFIFRQRKGDSVHDRKKRDDSDLRPAERR
jgi:diacylglycerol kinase